MSSFSVHAEGLKLACYRINEAQERVGSPFVEADIASEFILGNVVVPGCVLDQVVSQPERLGEVFFVIDCPSEWIRKKIIIPEGALRSPGQFIAEFEWIAEMGYGKYFVSCIVST